MDELKPCPFCGRSAVISARRGEHLNDPVFYRAHCKHCGISTKNYLQKRNAKWAWNRRAALGKERNIDGQA